MANNEADKSAQELQPGPGGRPVAAQSQMPELRRQALATLIGAVIGFVPSTILLVGQSKAQQHQVMIDRRVSSLNELRPDQTRMAALMRELRQSQEQAEKALAELHDIHGQNSGRIDESKLQHLSKLSDELDTKVTNSANDFFDIATSIELRLTVIAGLYRRSDVKFDAKALFSQGEKPPIADRPKPPAREPEERITQLAQRLEVAKQTLNSLREDTHNERRLLPRAELPRGPPHRLKEKSPHV